MSIHATQARTILHRFYRQAEPARKAAARAMQLREDLRDKELASIYSERIEALNATRTELAALAKTAREYAETESPIAIERNLTSSTSERTTKATAVRAMLDKAPLSELLAEAKAAAARYDVAAMRGVRLALLSRDLKPEESAPIVAALNSPHVERFKDAVEQAVMVQNLAARLEVGGAFGLFQTATAHDPVAALSAVQSAATVEIDGHKHRLSPERSLELSKQAAQDFAPVELSDHDAGALFRLGNVASTSVALATAREFAV